MFFLGRSVPDLAAATSVGTLALLASLIPIWWRTRPATAGRAATLPAEADSRVESRLQMVEEQLRGLVAEMEDGTRQIMELQERLDFAERLLTRRRDEPPEP
jgi:hypothetical protein